MILSVELRTLGSVCIPVAPLTQHKSNCEKGELKPQYTEEGCFWLVLSTQIQILLRSAIGIVLLSSCHVGVTLGTSSSCP
jgi:hypothetical protein